MLPYGVSYLQMPALPKPYFRIAEEHSSEFHLRSRDRLRKLRWRCSAAKEGGMVMAKGSQPNILFIQADQMTAFALKHYGNPLVRTPNIDRLAANGVVFENAYCNNPICASSRFSMMSGQLSSKIRAYDNVA